MNDNDTNCWWGPWNSPKMPIKRLVKLEDKRIIETIQTTKLLEYNKIIKRDDVKSRGFSAEYLASVADSQRSTADLR